MLSQLGPFRKLGALFLFLVFFFTNGAWAYHAARVADDNAELKTGPDPQTKTLTVLPRGTKVNTSDLATNGYFQVRSSTQSGWLPQDFLNFEGGFEPPPAVIKQSHEKPHPIVYQPSTLSLIAVGSMQISNVSSVYNSSNDTITTLGNTLTNNGLSSNAAAGAGFYLANQIEPSFSIELGVLYLSRAFTQNISITGGQTTTESNTYTFNYIQIPLLARFYFQEMFSFGFGGYVAEAFGNIGSTSVIGNSGLAGSNLSSSIPYQTAGISKTDYGLIFSLGAKIPLPGASFSIVGDARYNLGLANISNSGTNSGLTSVNSANAPDSNKWHDIELSVGVSFPI